MMRQVIGPVELQAGEHRRRAQPRSDPFVQPPIVEQQPVRRVMHQDGEAELARADHHHRYHEGERMGPPHEQHHAAEDQAPGVQHQQRTHEVRLAAQALDLLRRQQLGNFKRHDAAACPNACWSTGRCAS
jgi:hypothetical protein